MKKTTAILAGALLCVSLGGCGNSSSSNTVEIDTDQLAEALLDTVTSDTLTQTAESLIPSIYNLNEDDIVSAAAYASSGATACEVAVIQSKDADDTASVEESLQAHVDSQEELYASYNESEAARLETAIIESADAWTVLCVCDDTDGAEEILQDYGF